MMKFRVLGGKHAIRGADGVLRVYKKDEVVESSEQLDQKYVNHFIQVHASTPAADPTPVQAEAAKEMPKPEPAPEPPADDRRPNTPDFGEDVTAMFKGAQKADLKVFKSEKGYTVTHEDDPEVSVSGEPLPNTKAVAQFIRDYKV